jgi:hypothetical protein
MLSCKDVTDHSDEFLDNSLGLRQQLAVRLHLLICLHCRRYLRQLKALVRAVPFMHRAASEREVEQVMTQIRTKTENQDS